MSVDRVSFVHRAHCVLLVDIVYRLTLVAAFKTDILMVMMMMIQIQMV